MGFKKPYKKNVNHLHKTFANKKNVEQSKENKPERRDFPDTCQLIEPKSDLFWSTTDLQWALRILNTNKVKIIIALPKSLGRTKTFFTWFKKLKTFVPGPNLCFTVTWDEHVFGHHSSQDFNSFLLFLPLEEAFEIYELSTKRQSYKSVHTLLF